MDPNYVPLPSAANPDETRAPYSATFSGTVGGFFAGAGPSITIDTFGNIYLTGSVFGGVQTPGLGYGFTVNQFRDASQGQTLFPSPLSEAELKSMSTGWCIVGGGAYGPALTAGGGYGYRVRSFGAASPQIGGSVSYSWETVFFNDFWHAMTDGLGDGLEIYRTPYQR